MWRCDDMGASASDAHEGDVLLLLFTEKPITLASEVM